MRPAGAYPVWQYCLCSKNKRAAGTQLPVWSKPMKDLLDLPVINPHAAGIDIGSEKLFTSVAGAEPKVFLSVTSHLQELCAHLRSQGVRTVAMEATGVYWIN